MSKVVSVEILSGLPGSGKTHYAQNEWYEFLRSEPFSKDELAIVHFDQESIFHPQWFEYFRERLILDGLFLTNDEIIKVINDAHKKRIKSKTLEFTIIRWKEDRDACLHNDSNRRTESSKKTIKKAKFEYPDIERIKRETGYSVKIIEKDIVKKPESFNNLSKETASRIQGDFLVSKSWVLSGETRSYDSDWKPTHSSMIPDEIPDFEELYEFLEAVCPKLSFLDGRYIFKHIVSVRNYQENDYYSRTENAQYICNLKELMDYLTSKKYFEEEEK